MFIYTNSLIVDKPLLFVNEIFKAYLGEDDKYYLEPRTQFSLSFYLGAINGYEADYPTILQGISEISGETTAFWVGLKQVKVIADPVAGVYIGLIPETGAKELEILVEKLLTRKLVEEAEDGSLFSPYISLGWLSSPTIAENIASKINAHQFTIKWLIHELRLSEKTFPLMPF